MATCWSHRPFRHGSRRVCISQKVHGDFSCRELITAVSHGSTANGVNVVASRCAGMLAPDGRCKTLDASADGYVRAESCIVLALVAAGSDAADGAYGLFKCSAVNQVSLLSSTQYSLTCC